MYNFKPLSTPQQLSQQGGAPTGLPHPGSGMSAGQVRRASFSLLFFPLYSTLVSCEAPAPDLSHAPAQGVPMSNGGGPPPGISVGPNGQLVRCLSFVVCRVCRVCVCENSVFFLFSGLFQVGPGGTPLNPQQLQGIIRMSALAPRALCVFLPHFLCVCVCVCVFSLNATAQSLQQQFRAYQAARGAAGHTPIQPLGTPSQPCVRTHTHHIATPHTHTHTHTLILVRAVRVVFWLGQEWAAAPAR